MRASRDAWATKPSGCGRPGAHDRKSQEEDTGGAGAGQAAFTPGCTVEAHEFAEATDKFKALGATVIGVSHDPIEKLNKFSVSECRNKFAVASDADGSVMKNYDAVLAKKPEYANRTSYVIAPTGMIIYSYTEMNPEKHVENTMAAVKKWQDEHKKA